MNTEHTKHPCETVDASADVMKLAEMILSDCGQSTVISDRLQRRVAGRIQLHVDGLLGGQKTEPVEQGLYTILYRDNWDGEGDTSYLLARLDPNGEWYAEESGAQLMTYEGDAILRAWPITEDTAMRPDPKPVLNCWCCSTLVTFKQRADADGNCPHCGAELDVDEDLAAQQQAEPVNQQLLALVKSFGHKTGCAKNAFGEQCTCGADEVIAAAEQAPQAAVAAPLPPYNVFSDDDGDSWREHPADADFVEGLQLGDEFELLAGWRSVRVTFRVTKVPDDENDDYEVEEVTAPAAAQKGGTA